MKTTSRAISMAFLAAFALSLVFANGAFAADKCDPAACAAKCQAICKDSTLTEAQRLEKCKELCKGENCTAECKAKCDAACKATCPMGMKASTETGLIKTATATEGTSGCPHMTAVKATTAEATDAKVEANATTAKSGCAATCGAEAAKACAATKETCAMKKDKSD